MMRNLLILLGLLLVPLSASAQTPVGKPFFEAINNRPQFPGFGVKCDWDGVALTGTDDTAAMNAALASFPGGTQVEIAPDKRCLIDSANLVIPDNTVLVGMSMPGQLNGASTAILESGSGLVVNPLYNVLPGAGAALRNMAIRRKGLIVNPTVAQVNSQVAQWAAENSVAVNLLPNKAGIVLEDVLIEGFNTCIKSVVGRFSLSRVAGDCAMSGLDVSNTGDIWSADAVRFEPYYRTGAAGAGDAARPGIGFNFHDGGSAGMITNSFVFMYAYGAVINTSTAIWFTNSGFEWHDDLATATGIKETSCVRIVGGSGNIWLNNTSCSAYDRSFTNESNGGGIWWTNTTAQGNAGVTPTQYYLGAQPAASPPTMTWSGTLAPGEQIIATATDPTNVAAAPLAVSYTIQVGDTALKAAQNLATKLNSTWQLSKNYIRAAAAGGTGVLTIQYPVAYTTGSWTCSGTGGTTCAMGTGTASVGSTTMLSGVNSVNGLINVGMDGGPTNGVANAIIDTPWPDNIQPVGSWLQIGAGSVAKTKVYNWQPTGVAAGNLTACGSGPAGSLQASGSTDLEGIISEGLGATGCTLTFTTPFWAEPFCDVELVGGTGAITDFTVSKTQLIVNNISRSTVKYRCSMNGPRMSGTYTKPNPFVQLTTLAGGTCCGGATTETIIGTVKIPGGGMGSKGSTSLECLFTHPNSANLKTFRFRLTNNVAGATSANQIGTDATATTTVGTQTKLTLRNTASGAQVSFGGAPSAPYGSSATAVTTSASNTANDQYISVNGITASGAETITLNHCQATIANVP